MDYVDITDADELSAAIDLVMALMKAEIDLDEALDFLNASDHMRDIAYKALAQIEFDLGNEVN